MVLLQQENCSVQMCIQQTCHIFAALGEMSQLHLYTLIYRKLRFSD